MIVLSDITLRRGDRPLFEHLDLNIHDGQRVGLIGRNGVGKSSLFELLRGRLTPAQGDVRVPPRWTIGYMAQESDPSPLTAMEWTQSGDHRIARIKRDLAAAHANDDVAAEAALHGAFEDADGYTLEARAGEVLNGLGFAGDDFGKAQQEFSGGWRIRLNLARTLMTRADLLLLDEPTNHLDLDALLWLENWLARFVGTLIVIAHDRDFLDVCTTHTALLEAGRATLYRGNYTAYERARAEDLARQEAVHRRQAREAAHIQSFIDRFRAKASKAKQVQSRVKALERLQISAPAYSDSPYQFRFPNPTKMSRFLLEIEHGEFGYGEHRVLRDVRFSITPGARFGVLGHNGAGKSTFMKSLAGELHTLGGTFKAGMHARIGYFAQHQLESIAGESTPLTAMMAIDPAAREQDMRNHLGGWGFPGVMVDQRCRTLSGGEKARLVLALLAWQRPAILLLDEPTNHLDLDMRHALALALQDYTGAMVLVSHDREFMARTVDEYWLAGDGRLTVFDGDLSAYVAAVQAEKSTAGAPAAESDRKDRRRANADARLKTQALRTSLRNIERQIDTLSAELGRVRTQLADSATYTSMPAAELSALLAREGHLSRDLEVVEHTWLSQQEALEALQAELAK
ncbi:MAG: ATP-binding cassette domain-containing protein [Gammaproteobacteria bacterium]|nr:ATP-binding cassette domain-containing protein [Gammaproteobacteria bacterium]